MKIETLETALSLQNYAMIFSALTGINTDTLLPLLNNHTEFELRTVQTALSLGEFNSLILNANPQYVLAHSVINNGKEIYTKQMSTAKKLFDDIQSLKG